jgi:hypothetical protein
VAALLVTLDDYLTGPGLAPWRWGSLDCVLFSAGWVLAATGRDPAQGLRGTYATATGAHRLILRAGGMVLLVGPRLLAIGCARTDEPESGDVGVVRVPVDASGRTASVGAIRCGAFWAARGERALSYCDFPVVAAWRVPFSG